MSNDYLGTSFLPLGLKSFLLSNGVDLCKPFSFFFQLLSLVLGRVCRKIPLTSLLSVNYCFCQLDKLQILDEFCHIF